MRLISVIVGAENSKTRFNESATLLNFGFKNFESQKLADMTKAIDSIAVLKGKEKSVDVFAAEDFSAVVRKGNKSNYQVDVEMKESIKAPAKAGEVVGKIVISKDGNLVKKIDAIIREDVKHLSFFETAKKVVEKW